MNFLVDAQLPYRLKLWLAAEGLDVILTDDLPNQHLTSDLEIVRVADNENRIVISKDSDFIKLRILQNKPQRLLMITTGNIVNRELLELFEQNFKTAQKLFKPYDSDGNE